jgi:hypothetical protein
LTSVDRASNIRSLRTLARSTSTEPRADPSDNLRDDQRRHAGGLSIGTFVNKE